MLKFNQYIQESVKTVLDEFEQETQEQHIQDKLFGMNDYVPFLRSKYSLNESTLVESVEDHPDNPKRLIFHGIGRGGDASGIVVPRHMWEGSKKTGFAGVNARNTLRGDVYGHEHRPPLTLGQIEKEHVKTLSEHFSKPKAEQIVAEKAAIERLQRAKHLDSGNTTDEGEKTDTVKHEFDSAGRSFVAASSKGVAGHALYTSGSGDNQQHHILNTCPAQTKGCGGGVDANNIADTMKGTCFAPKAESQYVGASVRRATHEQAKHDPAMTNDWILAHAHSLRNKALAADKKNVRFLFRPNVVDETDRSSRHVIKYLNAQRAQENRPPIVANSYGKTNELHDPENNYYVTHSNTGPKVKHGASIAENISRDNQRVRATILATEGRSGRDITNDNGNPTPPKGSYMVTNMKRNSDLDGLFQQNVTHVKYWTAGREHHELSQDERIEGPEGHFDGSGAPTTPDKAHYGHMTINDRRYDYQKQHVLHPRMVTVGKNKDGTPHSIPTDSRFKDEEVLTDQLNKAGKERFRSKNGKLPGPILITTPTESTSNDQHHSAFTHAVDMSTIEHAKTHNGEYEIDSPHAQEAARNREYVPPVSFNVDAIKGLKKKKQPAKPRKKKGA